MEITIVSPAHYVCTVTSGVALTSIIAGIPQRIKWMLPSHAARHDNQGTAAISPQRELYQECDRRSFENKCSLRAVPTMCTLPQETLNCHKHLIACHSLPYQ